MVEISALKGTGVVEAAGDGSQGCEGAGGQFRCIPFGRSGACASPTLKKQRYHMPGRTASAGMRLRFWSGTIRFWSRFGIEKGVFGAYRSGYSGGREGV